jgi:hypothetical protein
MRLLLVIFLVVLILGFPGSNTSAQSESGPLEALGQYVRAVNARDFETAYRVFLFPRTNFRTFVDGWKYTQDLEAELGEFVPLRQDRERGNIPGLLLGTLTNGVVETYQGCYFMIAVDDVWYVEDFSFKRLFRRRPTSSDIERFTRFDCSLLRREKGLTTTPLPQNLEAVAELRELAMPVFRAGYKAIVVADNVSVRDRSTSAGSKIAVLNYGDTVTIVDGPLKSVRFVWWRVKLADSRLGWMAACSEDGTQLLDLP